MEILIAFFLAATILIVVTAVMAVLPVLALFALGAVLLRLFYLLLVPYLLWWFLAHGRKNNPKWERLRNFRYAHRGFHDKPRIPENSMTAFRRAAEHGFGAELDVHLTKDKRLAVIHDSSLRRVCNTEGTVEELTAEELGRLRLEGTDEKIPFLEDVLPIFHGRTPLVVEIKPSNGNWAELTAKTVECLDRFQVNYCVESFDPHCLLWLRKNRPEIVRGQLTQNFLADPSGLGLKNRFLLTALFYNVRTRPDFIANKFKDRKNPSCWLCCHCWGVQGVYWTIRSKSDLERAEREQYLVIFEKFDPEESPLGKEEKAAGSPSQPNAKTSPEFNKCKGAISIGLPKTMDDGGQLFPSGRVGFRKL